MRDVLPVRGSGTGTGTGTGTVGLPTRSSGTI